MSSERLKWLASHEGAVAGLRNLKTLAFVMQAETIFAGQAPDVSFSSSAIADRLWSWWTEDKAAMAGLLMRLAEREAGFERSVGVSELDGAQAQAFDQRTLRTPLRLNHFKRIEFTHDLAADWARYQWLRERAFQTEKWVSLAENPIWLPALRMLGEFLLRQKVDGEAGWDVTYRKLEQAARDVLLDALCLDPLAEQYLRERADALLAKDGALLLRLVQRFLHIATVAAVPAHILALDPTLRLQFEAHDDGELTFKLPALLEHDLDAFHAAHATKRVAFTLPMQCLSILENGDALSEENCSSLAQVLLPEWTGDGLVVDEDGQKREDDERTTRSARIAAAGTLLARGRDYLSEDLRPRRARGRKRALRTGLDNEVLSQVYDEVLNHER